MAFTETQAPPPSSRQAIILFDGHCNLCSGAVQFILKRDTKRYFRFASLQSPVGQQLLREYQLPAVAMDSFWLLEGQHGYDRSTAALRVVKKLRGLWPLLNFLLVIPKWIRDPVYNWVARNRYRWFGKREQCWVPGPQWSDRFLS